MFVELANTDGITIQFEMSVEIGIDEMCQLINSTADEVPKMLAKIRDSNKRDNKRRELCRQILHALAENEENEGLKI